VLTRLLAAFRSLTPLRRVFFLVALAGIGVAVAMAWRPSERVETVKVEPEQDGAFQRLLETPRDRQLARERDLADAIRTMEPVANASVKFVQVDKVFKSGPEAAASVLIELKPGAAFTRSHARAIAELVCGALPSMKAQNVKVIDTKGRLWRIEAENEIADLREQEAEYAAWIEEQVGKLFPQWRRAAFVRLTQTFIGLPSSLPPGTEASLSVVIPDDAPGVPRDAALREAFVKDAIAQIRTATGLETSSISVQLLPLPRIEPPPAATSVWPLAAGSTVVVLVIALVLLRTRRRPESGAPRESSEPFEFLSQVSVDRTVMLLKEEHAQAAALVLAHLPPLRAGEVLEKLPSRHQIDIVKRLSSLDGATPEAVAQVERALEGKLAILRARQTQRSGGPRTAAEILSQMRRETESQLMVSMMESDPELAERIRSAAVES
jgi:hypothetical protein